MNITTNLEVAQYMMDSLIEKGTLYSYDFHESIHKKFGEEFIEYTPRGNPKIHNNVGKEFKKLIADYNVHYDRREKCWVYLTT